MRTIPPTLDAVYHRILEQSSNAEDARKILHIVVGAARPLSLDEMNVAFCINSSVEEELDLEPCMASTLKAICSLFLRIREHKIYLVHQTAKEFLVSLSSNAATTLKGRDVSTSSSNDHPINIWEHSLFPVESHSVLTSACLLYLRLSAFDHDPLGIHELHDYDPTVRDRIRRYSTEHAFLMYASQHWVFHFREANERTMMDLSLEICDTQSNRFKMWYRIRYVGRNDIPPGCPQLVLRSFLGHTAAVRLLLDRGEDVPVADTRGHTALHWAAIQGDEATMELLLERKANIEAVNSERSTALGLATRERHVTALKLLLEHGAKVNETDWRGRAAIYWATFQQHNEAVNTLLQWCAEVNQADNNGYTPLHEAAGLGDEEIARLLLDHEPM